MREAIGTTYVLNFIIVFFVIFIAFFVGSMVYTKAFKVKNKIIDIIEYYDGDVVDGSNSLKSVPLTDINNKLGSIGYRIANNNQNNCNNNRFTDKGGQIVNKGNSNYRYCIYKFKENRGTYYGVVTYMYFEIPIIGAKLELPIYGETRTFIKL